VWVWRVCVVVLVCTVCVCWCSFLVCCMYCVCVYVLCVLECVYVRQRCTKTHKNNIHTHGQHPLALNSILNPNLKPSRHIQITSIPMANTHAP
jgi:hypothetical protein